MYIVFADNDPDFLNTRAEFLEQAGYRVLKAYTLAQARQFLTDAYVHLAILDIRMEDDDDEKDISGLTLAKDPAFRPIPKIMLTGFPSYQYVREALGPAMDGLPPVVDFLAKQEGPEALIQAVERAFTQHMRLNRDLVIRWDEREPLSFPCLVGLIQPAVPPEHLPDRVGELEDLFRKLFYSKRQITLGRLLWHREGRACLTAFAYSPEGALEQRIITCGLRPQVEHEIAHYKEFAPKGGIGTALAGSAETMHFAAVAYALPEADLEQAQTFEAFYWTNKVAQIREVIQHLFQTTLAAWHQEGRILEETRGLRQLYRERLDLTRDKIAPEELQRRMQALAQEALSLGPVDIELSLGELILRLPNGDTAFCPNPVLHLYDETGDGQSVICRLTPGTLRGDNILVDQEWQTWLTDFAQAGSAPLSWDFVSLEAIIRFDLVDSLNLQALYEFERRLVTPAHLNERLDAQDIEPPFRKALGSIQEIRHQAFSVVGLDLTSYYTGLFFHAVRRMADYTPELRHTRQELVRLVRALLAAAMLCSKMTQRAEASPRALVYTKGIEVDEADRQVWVEGRRVALTPTEFDVLLYLYTHSGKLCTRRSIVEEALKGKYLDTQQEMSRINTIMGRLRKKIESDPDHPRYLITVRGQGYKLMPG